MVVCDVGFQMAGICSWLLIWCYICGFMIMGPDDGFLVSGSGESYFYTCENRFKMLELNLSVQCLGMASFFHKKIIKF